MTNTYEDVLPLDEVKNYLRVDNCFDEDDDAIKRMIASAFGFIEKQTNHIFKPQEKTYYKDYSGVINVYDFPINTTELPENVFPLNFSGFTRFCGIESVMLNVGYVDRDKVPSELIEAALQMIKVWYFEAEKKSNTTLIPENVKEILISHKRFIIC